MGYQADKILVVEDEQILRKALCSMLSDNGFRVLESAHGVEALDMLSDHEDVSAIALDWMMPHMNGIQFLKQIKHIPRYRDIPVIMQTAAIGSDNIQEGVANGVYYYLTKPYHEETLLAVIKSALADKRKYDDIRSQVNRAVNLVGLMQHAVFHFQNTKQANDIVYTLSRTCPKPEEVAIGLNELCLNAIEHGNLGITYCEKKQLVTAGTWQDEIDRRLSLVENHHKQVVLTLDKQGSEYAVTITDEGEGFDWRSFMEFDVKRATDPNGRGIFIANSGCFRKLEYNELGNQVICYIEAE